MEKISLSLNILNADGQPVDETRPVEISKAALADIVDHAIQIAVLKSQGEDVEDIVTELAEAVESCGLTEAISFEALPFLSR